MHRTGAAMDDFSQAISLDGSNVDNFIARGRGYSNLGEIELAQNDFKSALSLDPESSDAYKFRGLLSTISGDFTAAVTDLDRAIDISPADDDAFHFRASAYIGLGDVQRALEDLNTAVEIGPTDPDHFYSRGVLKYNSNDITGAIDDFDKSTALAARYVSTDPRLAKPYLERSRAYLQLKNPTKTISDALTTLQILNSYGNSPEWANLYQSINLQITDAYRLLGDAYTLLGRLEEAKTSYERAAEAP